jgi:hypothetical protein
MPTRSRNATAGLKMNASNNDIASNIKRSNRRNINVMNKIPASVHKIIFDVLPAVAAVIVGFFK